MPAPPAYTRRGQPLPGPDSLPTESGQAATYDTLGTFVAWATVGTGVTDHGALTGLTDDDHTQYALLAGRAGGQTLIGGTGSGDDLVLSTTSHGTKGTVQIDGQTDGGTGARLAVPSGIYTSGFVWATGGVTFAAGHNLTRTTTPGGTLVTRSSQAIQVGNGGGVFRTISGSGNTLEFVDQATGGMGSARARTENYTTAGRPAAGNVGRAIYDTTLNKPLWDDGTQWRDASGTIV